MRISILRAIILATSVALLQASMAAAGPIKPPSVQLVAPQNQVVVARIDRIETAHESPSDPRLHVSTIEVLTGEPLPSDAQPSNTPKTLSLRFESDVDAIAAGDRIILGWSDRLPDRFAHGLYKGDPEGARVIRLAGAGAALWPDTDALRRFVLAARSADSVTIRSSVIELLERARPGEKLLAASELAHDPALLLGLDERTRHRIDDVLKSLDPITETSTARFLLDAIAFAKHPSVEAVELARRAIESIAPDVDPASNGPGLLVRAAGLVARMPAKGDARRLLPLVVVDHPGIASAAWDALFAVAPKRARRLAREAITRGTLTADLVAQLNPLLSSTR